MRFLKKVLIGVVTFCLLHSLLGTGWSAESGSGRGELSALVQGLKYRDGLLNQGRAKLHCTITHFPIPEEKAKSIADRMREQDLLSVPSEISEKEREQRVQDIEKEWKGNVERFIGGSSTQQEINFLFKEKKFKKEIKSVVITKKGGREINEPGGHVTFIFDGENLINFNYATKIATITPAEKATGMTHNLCKLIMNGFPSKEIIQSAAFTLKEKDSKTGDYVLDVVLPQKSYRAKTWVNSKKGYTIPRADAYDSEGNLRQAVESTQYKLVNKILWCPMQTTFTTYSYSEGKKRTSHQIVYSVDRFELNIPIEDSAFKFDFSKAKLIQDEHFDPPMLLKSGDYPQVP